MDLQHLGDALLHPGRQPIAPSSSRTCWRRSVFNPDGALLLNHLSQTHPVELKPLLQRMATEDIGTVAMEAFERVELS